MKAQCFLENNSWKTILHAVLILRVCACFGSEDAVDKVINLSHYIYKLQNYNSALNQKTGLIFTGSGGQDHGGTIREHAKELFAILKSDETIRAARQKARDVKDEGNTTGLGNLVPMGNVTKQGTDNQQPAMSMAKALQAPLAQASLSMLFLACTRADQRDSLTTQTIPARGVGILGTHR